MIIPARVPTFEPDSKFDVPCEEVLRRSWALFEPSIARFLILKIFTLFFFFGKSNFEIKNFLPGFGKLFVGALPSGEFELLSDEIIVERVIRICDQM